MTSSESTPKHIVIIGGGIIGCTTAYYLTSRLSSSENASQSTTSITLIEASIHGPAQGASGKAGGLVARWAYPKELVSMSYPEHERLAQTHDGKERWGWRYVNCGTWEGRGEDVGSARSTNQKGQRSLEKELGLPGGTKPKAQGKGKGRKEKGLPQDLEWVKEELTDAYSPMAKDGETAQVHPYLFTTSMFELAKERGLKYIHGFAKKIIRANAKVTGVEYREGKDGEFKIIEATHVVLAAGAWSPRILEELPISPTRAHSVTIRPSPDVKIAPYVLFTEISMPISDSSTDYKTVSPEIYARPDNEVYACGPGDDFPLPDSVDEVQVDPEACNSIVQHVSSISEELRAGTVEKRQACYLPTVDTGNGPIIGEARDIAEGLYIATGHTCWVSHFHLLVFCLEMLVL